ncbi:CrcB family protein [Priestia megaterium]|nr:CrcB family protein [Priestia megaterium]
MKMNNIIAIGVGAIAGTYARYQLNITLLFTGYPLGTLIENIAGSFLLGGLTGFFTYQVPKEWLKLGLGVGLCGGFTTFSTFASDSVSLFSHDIIIAGLYMIVSLLGGIFAALAGYLVGEKIGDASARTQGGSR